MIRDEDRPDRCIANVVDSGHIKLNYWLLSIEVIPRIGLDEDFQGPSSVTVSIHPNIRAPSARYSLNAIPASKTHQSEYMRLHDH